MDSARGTRRRRSVLPAWCVGFSVIAVTVSLLATRAAAQSSGLQIIGVQQDDCGLSPNLWQTRPTFVVCAAQEAPFLVRRYGYKPLEASCSAEGNQTASGSTAMFFAEDYDRIEKVRTCSRLQTPHTCLIFRLYCKAGRPATLLDTDAQEHAAVSSPVRIAFPPTCSCSVYVQY